MAGGCQVSGGSVDLWGMSLLLSGLLEHAAFVVLVVLVAGLLVVAGGRSARGSRRARAGEVGVLAEAFPRRELYRPRGRPDPDGRSRASRRAALAAGGGGPPRRGPPRRSGRRLRAPAAGAGLARPPGGGPGAGTGCAAAGPSRSGGRDPGRALGAARARRGHRQAWPFGWSGARRCRCATGWIAVGSAHFSEPRPRRGPLPLPAFSARCSGASPAWRAPPGLPRRGDGLGGALPSRRRPRRSTNGRAPTPAAGTPAGASAPAAAGET